MKRILFALLLVSLSFAADWQPLALVAVIASLSALAMLFTVGYAFGIDSLKFLAREELVQVFATGLLIAGFASFQIYLAGLSSGLGGGVEIAQLAKDKLAEINGALSGSNALLVGLATHLGKESSKSVFCSFSSVSFSVASCAGFAAVAGPFPLAFQAIGAAAGEISTLNALLDFGAGANSLVFTLFFPLGLFLRTFKLTRGAGGLLIAVAITFYLILPYSVVFVNQTIVDTQRNLEATYGTFGSLAGISASYEDCDEYDFGDGNEGRAIAQFRAIIGKPNGTTASYVQSMVYQVLIRSTLMLAAVLSIMAASIRAFSAIAGAEIDVSPLARLL